MKDRRIMKHVHAISLLVAQSATLLAAGCATAPAVDVPDALRPPSNETLARTVAARGVQVYECRVGKDGAGYEWAFVAPDAELFDTRNRSIGRHGAGPSWQALDGSRIVGTVKARADSPSTGAIPWLLLSTKSTGVAGEFSGVTSVQRVNTLGGVAPEAPCTDPVMGTTVRVPYAADYRLFVAR